ncbi:transposase [Burkholderia cepacia]|uniref:transposase n=1 Tax=Burkholderia cepacia TaxID=292 RepID=UPI0021AB409C|nr:transposase [Burkholderia cepacia]
MPNAQSDAARRAQRHASRRQHDRQADVAARRYGISQVIRKRIEEHFGWGKTVGRIRQTAYRGIKRVDQHFKLTMLASNLTRMARILTAVPQGATR